MLINEEGFEVLDAASSDADLVQAERDYPLADEELFKGRPDPEGGLFIATCGEVAPTATLGERFMGASVAGASLRAGLIHSGLLRRWYSIVTHQELDACDRHPASVVREHLVPMPMAWRVVADEGVALMQQGFIHALLSTGHENPRNYVFRAALQTPLPVVGFLHSIPDVSAELVSYYAAQTFPFDLLISPSQCGKTMIENHFERLRAAVGAQPFAGRVEVVPHGVKVPELSDKGAARKTLGWSSDDVIILSLGRFDADYKADLAPLLVAFSQLLQKVPNARLVLAGASGDAYPLRLDALGAELGIAERLEIRDTPSENTKTKLLAGADVFCALADNVQETHGLSVLEAMAARLPVVAAQWNGFAETVVHGQTGFLAPTKMAKASAELAAASVLWMGHGRTMPLQPQLVTVDIDALRQHLQTLCLDPTKARTMGDAGHARVLAYFEVMKTGHKAAELIVESVREARRSTLSWRPHLASDWSGVYGHYAHPEASTKTGVFSGPRAELSERWFSHIDRGLRRRIRPLLERMRAEAVGQSPEALIDVLSAEFATIPREAVRRWIDRAAKQGWIVVKSV